jgi:putative ABC transport system permease protein
MTIRSRLFFFKIVLSSLARRRSRVLVAVLAVAIGATVFLGMGAVYYDIPRQMGREFRSYGANLVFIPAGGGASLRLEDAARAVALLPGDALLGVTPFRYETMYYNMHGLTVAGADLESAKKTSPYWQVQGAWPATENEVLLGADVAEYTRLYPGSVLELEMPLRAGRRARHSFTVSGVIRSGGPEDGFALLPLSGLEKIFGTSGEAALVEVSIALGGPELELLAREVEEKVSGLTPRLVRRITSSETTVLNKLRVLVYLVTAVVLFLTMICVGTTMMTVVMERRGEIGLKKAIGAENKSIVCEFLGEGAALALLGGGLGACSGYFFAQAVSMSVFGRGVALPFILVLLTLGASLLVTLLASVLPVVMAARVEPALVLRGE